jgi:hypothetical protein
VGLRPTRVHLRAFLRVAQSFDERANLSMFADDKVGLVFGWSYTGRLAIGDSGTSAITRSTITRYGVRVADLVPPWRNSSRTDAVDCL